MFLMPAVSVLVGAFLQLSSNRGIPWILAYTGAILIMVAGAAKLFRAKLPLYRQRQFFTWGPLGLPPEEVPRYWSAIRLVVIGGVAAVFLLVPRLLLGV